ncbi:NtaA/DmoA family FMN-dependent monooxygenase [Streptomyces sp. NPDC048282]|uniref:NtaA/DmoA family FMN-dependent monooxygenase n=1 Tax=unclassified Streptomyces TaxID=2593676 RepID=UPI0037192F07
MQRDESAGQTAGQDGSGGRRMVLGATSLMHGSADQAWRWPGGDPGMSFDVEPMIRAAREAERGKFHFVFITDHPAVQVDLTRFPPTVTMDPIVLTSRLITATSRIGFVLTQSTTFSFPYTVARQLKALDLLSGGRIGWNAVTTNDPRIAANFGAPIADRTTRYERAHEFVQLVQALWGSWGPDALKLDTDTGVFADASEIRPIDLGGRHVASRGPLPIPPSPQGQPILFQAGGGAEALGFAASYASGVFTVAGDIEEARAHRDALDQVTTAYGRSPQDVKLVLGTAVTVADTMEAALERRHQLLQLSAPELPDKLRHLSALVGLPLTMDRIHDRLDPAQLAALRPAPHQLYAEKSVRLLTEGRTPYEVLLHGVTDFFTTVLGSPEDIADQLQLLFESRACDGFVIAPDVTADGLPAFVDKVVPVLQRRGLFHHDYEGSTLREHLGAPYQYGRTVPTESAVSR